MILVGFLLNNLSEDDYSKENRYSSSNRLSLSKTKSFIKSDMDYSNKDYMKSSSKSKNSSRGRKSDSDSDQYNPEMEYTFNRV